MNLEFIKPQNLGSLLMKSSQSNFDLRAPSSFLVRSQLIATVSVLVIGYIVEVRFHNPICNSVFQDVAYRPTVYKTGMCT